MASTPLQTRVVLGATALASFAIRDTLLRAARAQLYQPLWSSEILQDAEQLVAACGAGDIEADLAALRSQTRALTAALVSGHGRPVARPSVEPGARSEVWPVAVAVVADAPAIVHRDIANASGMPAGVMAITADEYLCELVRARPEKMLAVSRDQATAMAASGELSRLYSELVEDAPGYSRAILMMTVAPEKLSAAAAEAWPRARLRGSRGEIDPGRVAAYLEMTPRALAGALRQSVEVAPSSAGNAPLQALAQGLSRLSDLVSLIELAHERMRVRDAALAWMRTAHPGLGGKSPLEATLSGASADKALELARS